MCNLSDLLVEKGMEQGLEKGREDEKRSTVLRLLQFGDMPVDTISVITELPVDEIKKLASLQPV